MRVLHLYDEIFTLREATLLERVRIGLADEGLRVGAAIPEAVGERAEDLLAGPVVLYPGVTPLIGAGLRASRLLDQATALLGGPPDAVHAFGGHVWPLADLLSRRAGCPLVLEVWRRGLVNRLRAQRSALARGRELVLLAPWVSIERELRRDLDGQRVRLTPWGVHPDRDAAARRAAEQTEVVSVVLAGSARSSRRVAAAFKACLALMRAGEPVHVLADDVAAGAAQLWKLARDAGAEDRLSVVPELEGDRRMALRSDVLAYAGQPGECRTLLLDAMASRMAVVAGDDERNDGLSDGVSALIVEGGDKAAWEVALGEVVRRRERREELGASAAAWVREKFPASVHVSSLIDVYESLAAQPPVGFTRG